MGWLVENDAVSASSSPVGHNTPSIITRVVPAAAAGRLCSRLSPVPTHEGEEREAGEAIKSSGRVPCMPHYEAAWPTDRSIDRAPLQQPNGRHKKPLNLPFAFFLLPLCLAGLGMVSALAPVRCLLQARRLSETHQRTTQRLDQIWLGYGFADSFVRLEPDCAV